MKYLAVLVLKIEGMNSNDFLLSSEVREDAKSEREEELISITEVCTYDYKLEKLPKSIRFRKVSNRDLKLIANDSQQEFPFQSLLSFRYPESIQKYHHIIHPKLE